MVRQATLWTAAGSPWPSNDRTDKRQNNKTTQVACANHLKESWCKSARRKKLTGRLPMVGKLRALSFSRNALSPNSAKASFGGTVGSPVLGAFAAVRPWDPCCCLASPASPCCTSLPPATMRNKLWMSHHMNACKSLHLLHLIASATVPNICCTRRRKSSLKSMASQPGMHIALCHACTCKDPPHAPCWLLHISMRLSPAAWQYSRACPKVHLL